MRGRHGKSFVDSGGKVTSVASKGRALAQSFSMRDNPCMNTELHVLAWGCILALIHIFAAAQVKTRQYGTKWNMGARDEALAPPTPLVGRLSRAQANFFETFPLYAAAALLVTLAHLNNRWTAIGALLWIGARIVYLPLYALGVPVVRTLVFIVSLAGILMVLRPALSALFH
jgi:uncharacterized MAPEG superfamily protein